MATSGVGGRITWIVKVKLKTNYTDLAKKLGTTKQLVSRWVNDAENPPGTASIAKIARIAGVSRAWLQYGQGSPDATTPSGGDLEALQVAIREMVDIGMAVLNMEPERPEEVEELKVEVSKDGVVQGASSLLCEMLGFNEDSLVGRTWEGFVHKDDQERTALAVSSARGGGVAVTFQSRHASTNGEAVVEWFAEAREGHVVLRGEDVDGPMSIKVSLTVP